MKCNNGLSRLAMSVVLAWTVTIARSQIISVPQSDAYTNDSATVLLEHFEGSTSGAISGPSVTFTNGIFGQGVHLDLGSWVSWNFGGFSEATVEFWGKLDHPDVDGHEYLFIRAALAPFVGDTFVVTLRTNHPSSSYHCGFWIGSVTEQPFSTENWHHYATTWGRDGYHFYVDGELIHSTTQQNPQNGGTSFWAIGGPSDKPSASGIGFAGVIDELRISNIQRSFAPMNAWLEVNVSKVIVTQHVTPGRRYVLESSQDCVNWLPVGSAFTPEGDILKQEFDVASEGRFFRIREAQ